MKKKRKLKGITEFLFVTTQLAALFWVSLSYIISAYATVRLKEPYPAIELSQQAITSILGVNVLKVIQNIFEHNDGVVMGKKNKKMDKDATI